MAEAPESRDASHLEERPRQRLSMLLAPSPDSLLTLDEA